MEDPPEISESTEHAYEGSASPEKGRKEDLKEEEEGRVGGWRKVVRNFVPSWFAITMGTGVVSTLLNQLPYNSHWLYWLSVTIFALNVTLWCTFFLISLLRYIIYPEQWSSNIRNVEQAVFIATCPTGLSTIINMVIYVCVPAWGIGAARFAWALWWLDAAASVICCLYLPFTIMVHEHIKLSDANATWLLPMVAVIVASATGTLVGGSLNDPDRALWTIIASYILLGIGFLLAMIILVLYFARLIIHGLPPRTAIVSSLITLGPLGSGSFAFMQAGIVARRVFKQTHTLPVVAGGGAGDVLYVAGWMIALLIWGFSVLWLFFAIAGMGRRGLTFNMSWWGFTFPLGVFTSATNLLGAETPSRFFKVLSTIFTVCVTLLWLIVACGTVVQLFSGKILEERHFKGRGIGQKGKEDCTAEDV